MKRLVWATCIMQVLLGVCIAQQEDEFVSNGTDLIKIPDQSEIRPVIYYDFIKEGLLDEYYFLTGENSPLTPTQIKTKLDEIMSEDPFDHPFYTIRDFPDKKFPQDPEDIINPLTCLCSDVPPQTYLNENPELGPIEKLAGLEQFPNDCLEAEQLGLCENTTFIMETMPVYVPEGFCERSCGRCDCCDTLLGLVQEEKSLSTFLELAEITGLDKQLSSPATIATVLAPNNAALSQALETLGITIDSLKLAGNDAIKQVVEEILLFHMLPSHPFFEALWTTPFFVKGEISDTYLSSKADVSLLAVPQVSFLTSEENETFVVGPWNAATIVKPDIEACKGYLNIIDTVLLPFDPETFLLPEFSTSTGSEQAPEGPVVDEQVPANMENGDQNVEEPVATMEDSAATADDILNALLLGIGVNASEEVGVEGGDTVSSPPISLPPPSPRSPQSDSSQTDDLRPVPVSSIFMGLGS